jgi:membrane-bound serine protease (ClpP class)
MFNRMVLPPPGELAEGRFPSEGDEGPMTPYDNILGDVGVAASPLRPVGRMKLGSQYFDVITNGEFVEAGRRIEVVEVHHNRIVVRSIQDLV